MTYERGAAESARFALLGLLLAGPSHGYELARQFDVTTVVGSIVHLSPSHLYALLRQLERDGLVAGTRQEVGSRPPRHVHRLTDKGREMVQCWIDQPVEHPRDMRLDFPLKLYLARRLSAERAARLVAAQHALFASYIQRQESQVAPEGGDGDAEFIALLREGRIGRLRAALDWLDRCAALPGEEVRFGT